MDDAKERQDPPPLRVREDRETAQAHILVVDDDARLRELLSRFLRDNGYLVTTARDAAEARARLNGITFDLIVLDIMMPGESGLELTEALRLQSSVPVLLLSARGEPEDRIAGLERGADDYLPKPFEPRELLLRIRTIMRRSRPHLFEDGGVPFGGFRFDAQRGELWHREEQIRLTRAEVTFLKLFALNPGKVFSRADLCERTNAGLERSVDVQINRLRRKIEPNPKEPTYLQTVRGIGYVFVPG
ncbi:MAG: response regulator [Alphaproteobacteria bacterium]|nr:response regulator [Alphaproteobacteria bacterium]